MEKESELLSKSHSYKICNTQILTNRVRHSDCTYNKTFKNYPFIFCIVLSKYKEYGGLFTISSYWIYADFFFNNWGNPFNTKDKLYYWIAAEGWRVSEKKVELLFTFNFDFVFGDIL